MEPSNRGRPIVPQFWAGFYEETHIPAAVLANGRLYVTGHTGTLDDGTFPEGAEAQIRQAFRNIAVTLSESGVSWDDVVELSTYHVNLSAQTVPLLRVASEFLRDPYPAWTAAGVSELFEPEAVFEISCQALAADRDAQGQRLKSARFAGLWRLWHGLSRRTKAQAAGSRPGPSGSDLST